MPIFSSTGATIPSRSSTSAASKCTGTSSELPCSEASSLARWTASCAFTVNLSQRIAINSTLNFKHYSEQREEPVPLYAARGIREVLRRVQDDDLMLIFRYQIDSSNKIKREALSCRLPPSLQLSGFARL